MSCAIFKVNPDTLDKLQEIASKHDVSFKEILDESINNYWIKTCLSPSQLITTSEEEFEVTAKPEFAKKIESFIEKNNKLLVEKTYRSNLGFSDGLYKLKGNDILLPVDWFEPAKAENRKIDFLLIITWALNVVQAASLTYILFFLL